MAEATIFRNNALPYCVYGLPWVMVLPILDEDGDPVTDGTIDSLVSLNGDTAAADATPVQIATTTGLFYLALTAANMTADIVSGSIGSTTSGAKRTLFTLYPRKLPILLTSDNAGAYDSTTTINLGSGASSIDAYYNGCIVYIYGGTGIGQVRKINNYVGSTKIATVHVAWATNPDATSDLKIYRTDLAPYVISPTDSSGITTLLSRIVGTLDSGTHTAQTGDSYAIVNSGTYGNAAIKGYVDDIGIAGAGLTAIPWNATWDAEVQSECTDAITAYDPPTNTEMEARTIAAASYATPTNITAGTITTVTYLTNPPSATLSELTQGVPPATPTIAQAIMLLYMALRNDKKTTATELSIYNDAGTKITKAVLSDDGTTFDKAKLISGA